MLTRALAWLVLVCALAPGAATAAFRSRIDAGPVRLESPPQLRGTLEDLATRTETILPELEKSLGVEPSAPIVVVLIPAGQIIDPEIAQFDRAAPPWAAGFALTEQRVIGIRLGRADRYPFGDASAVLAHELAHVLVHDAIAPGGGTVPRWFTEGVATWEQRRWSMRDAVVYSSSLMLGGLPTLGEMDRAFLQSEATARTAYAASFDFVNWSAEEYGEEVVRRVLQATRTEPFPEAWQAATGVALTASEAAWRSTAITWYRWIPVLTGAGTLWLAITLLFLAAAWHRRRKTQAILAQMEIDDLRAQASRQTSRQTMSLPSRPPRPVGEAGRTGRAGPAEPARPDKGRDEEGNWVN